jgi:anti-anti-sigma factor
MNAHNNSSHSSILVVDDDPIILSALEETLHRDGYQVFTAKNGEEAIVSLEKQPVALILCDQRMPGISGIDVLIKAQELQPEATRIVLTGNADLETVLNAFNLGKVSQFINKPWDDTQLRQTVALGCETYRLLQDNKMLHGQLEEQHAGLRRELKLGAKIHEKMLLGTVPKQIPGIAIEAMSVASKEIDGDFFEFYRPGQNILDVVVGDVMGKGIPAALVGTAVKTQLLRFAIPYTHVHQFSRKEWWEEDLLAPQEILEHVHDELIEQLISLEYFVSLFYGRFNLRKQTLAYVDCGSMKPIHYKSNEKKAVFVSGKNFPLGSVDIKKYELHSTGFSVGDFFVFYSDGVTETRSPEKEFFGFDRLIAIIEKHANAEVNVIIQAIKDSVIDFAKKETFDDDLTLLIIKFNSLNSYVKKEVNIAKFSADLSQLKAVRDFINRLCLQAPGDCENLSNQLQLAINELFCNIVKHGYKGIEGGTVVIHGELKSDGILLEISDQGRSFDPREVEEPNLAGERENGFGWYLVKEISSTVAYEAKEAETGWNHTKIFRKFMFEGIDMLLEHATDNNVLIITPKGQSLDAKDAPAFKEEVINLITVNDLNRVVLDLQHLDFIDSSGLGTFLSVLRVLHSTGGELKLARMNKTIRTMFELVSMHKVFEIFNSTDEAVRSFKANG